MAFYGMVVSIFTSCNGQTEEVSDIASLVEAEALPTFGFLMLPSLSLPAGDPSAPSLTIRAGRPLTFN
jgi:hypothetical protein